MVAWTDEAPFMAAQLVVVEGRVEQVLYLGTRTSWPAFVGVSEGTPRLRRVSSPFGPPPAPAECVERALCVLAHPDDVDFGSAGTVATWTAAGTEVTYCMVTDGDAGGFDETPRDQMGPLRQAEQRAAATALGVEEVRFLGYPDGRLELTLDLRRDISRVIRQVRPQRVLTSSPERWFERIGASHPDHMIVGESTLRAVYPDARNPFAFPELLGDEGLEAWTVSEVWLGASPRANHAVDVTDVLQRKWAALGSHVSQLGHWPEGRMQQFVGGWMRETAKRFDLLEGRFAEAFQVVHTG